MRPAIVSGGLMAFILSMDAFVVTCFTSGPDSVTLPLRIFWSRQEGARPSLNVISALFIVDVIVMVLFSERLRRRQRRTALADPASVSGKAKVSVRRFFGRFASGNPDSANNEAIDADLAREAAGSPR